MKDQFKYLKKYLWLLLLLVVSKQISPFITYFIVESGLSNITGSYGLSWVIAFFVYAYYATRVLIGVLVFIDCLNYKLPNKYLITIATFVFPLLGVVFFMLYKEGQRMNDAELDPIN